ncbi:MAG: ATP-binding protein [Thermodesulfobacteriota bacterium]
MRSVSKRFSYAFIGIITLLLMVFAGAVILLDSAKINHELEARLESVLKLAKISLPTPLWNLDNDIVNNFVEALFLDESIVFAEVVWGDEIIARRIRDNVPQGADGGFSDSGEFIDRTSDIFYEGNKVGTIRLTMSRHSVRKEQIRVGGMITILTVLIIGSIAITSLVITKKYITLPLTMLQESASAIAEGNLDSYIDKSGNDEIGLLARNLDVMRGSIKELFLKLNASKKEIEDYSRTLEQKVLNRTRELAQSVEELQALGEVSQVINSTLDLEIVLNSIVRHAVALSETDAGAIFEFDEESQLFTPKIHFGVSDAFARSLNESKITRGDGTAVGQATDTLAPVQIADLSALSDYPLHFVLEEDFQALLAVPLMREKQVIGGLVVLRKRAGQFSKKSVELLQTFADQSVLAIHNARLFLEIDEKGRELELADKHKSEFLANMSHELRTPLNAILGYTELIVDGIYGEVPEKISDVLSRLDKNGRHLLQLINDVLDLSKIEAGRFTLSVDQYSLAAVIQTVVQSIESLAAEKGLILKVDIEPDLPVGTGDEQRLAQVLLNLLGNSIKFTEQGEVSVRAALLEDNYIVSVADTGCGLSDTDQEKIFEEFKQVDGSSTREKGGTGLGLTIAKKIVEMHQGTIGVESEPGQGATFTFTLPVRYGQEEERS